MNGVKKKLLGVPQRSVLGILLFKISINKINEIFDFIQDACNFADYNPLYSIEDNLKLF